MEFKLKKPCSTCPFRSDQTFYLAKDRRQEIVEALRSDKTFTCHNTIDYNAWSEADEFVPDEHNQHCAGALLVMQQSGELYDNFLFRLANMAGMFDPEKLDQSIPVYGSLDLWVEAGEEQ